ncbi:hypothetical protein HDU80_010787 [Chytriomyces hyalinus]|nr:hypothetical protein HDU80_010787 [Chytriomyces hyalinus]
MPAAPKHIWKPEQVTFMLDELLLQVLAGKRCGQTVKKESWAIVMARFIRRFNCPIDLSKMKSKMQSQKSLFQLVLRMKKLSGWGWDELKSRPEANPDVIAAFISALKATEQKSAWDIVKYGLPDYKVLSDLFEANLATGDLARGSNENNEPDPDPQDADLKFFSVTPVTNRGASKRSAQPTAIGERPKQSHTNSAPSSAKTEFRPVKIRVQRTSFISQNFKIFHFRKQYLKNLGNPVSPNTRYITIIMLISANSREINILQRPFVIFINKSITSEVSAYDIE